MKVGSRTRSATDPVRQVGRALTQNIAVTVIVGVAVVAGGISRLTSRLDDAANDERGEVIQWVVMAVGIVGITVAVIALLRPAVLNAAQEIVGDL